MMSPANVTSTVQLAGRYGIDAMNGLGTVLAHGTKVVAVVRPDGSTRIWQTDGEILSCALSESERVAILELHPAPSGRSRTLIRVVSADATTELRLDANVTGGLIFDCGTGGAIAWAEDVSLWLATATDDVEGGLWIGRIDLAPVAVCGATFADPYAESYFRFVPGATRARCSFNLDAGQHGGWAYVAVVDGSVSIEHLVPGDGVTSHFEPADGSVVALEGWTLVRWSADRSTRDVHALGEGGFPIAIVPASQDRAVIELDRGTLLEVDVRAMRTLGTVSLGNTLRDDLVGTVGSADRFATALASGTGDAARTTIAFWTLPTP